MKIENIRMFVEAIFGVRMDGETPLPQDDDDLAYLQISIWQALDSLPQRLTKVLVLRYGLIGDGKWLSLEDTAKMLPRDRPAPEGTVDGKRLTTVTEYRGYPHVSPTRQVVFTYGATVTRERVRQMEAKALRMLRHPHRADMLRAAIPSMAKEKK